MKRFPIVLVILIVAVVGRVVWQVLSPREPIYEGKPLSEWLENYEVYPPYDAGVRAKADEAVRQIGTNAIPTLLRLLQANDPPWKLHMVGLLKKQQIIRIKISSATKRNWEAVPAFEVLGADAKDAVPALIKIFERNISGQSQSATAFSLAGIGPPAKSAIPMFMKEMTNPNAKRPSNWVYILGEIRSSPESVVPLLCNSLTNGDLFTRVAIADALGKFGAAARPAVPALINLLKDQDSKVRAGATNALKQIDPEATAQAGVR